MPGSEALQSLSGQAAIVTGASRGIGAAIAESLRDAGVTVFGLSRTATAPAGVTPVACDLANVDAIPDAVRRICDQSGTLGILVNAAGITFPPAVDEKAELARFRQTLDVDLVAAYATCLAARPYLKRSGKASIINVTSINAKLGFPDNPGYVAAKAGLAGLTRALAVDFASDGIRVNSVAPGYVHTQMTEKSFANPVANEQRRRQTALGRWGEPKEIASVVAFLASDAAAYVTGQELFVDGGWTIKGLVT